MIAHRTFESYDAYVYKQGRKARDHKAELLAHVARNICGFTKAFRRAAPHLKVGPVLCLGARTGAESIGATRAGFHGSVGIDLHPVGPTVLRGDWHDLGFPSQSFANVYCNSLDHCLDLDRLAAGVRRVLMDGGRFYVMALNRSANTPDEWLANDHGAWNAGHEALYWRTTDDLADAIRAHGFTVVVSWHERRWSHYVFRAAAQ